MALLHEYPLPPDVPAAKLPAAHRPASTQHAHDSAESDEDVALLRRGTVVRIVGNARTKSVYIGQTGIVKRAVGLGGWHWLVLSNGEEIKLQRNALLVLEVPKGDQQDFSEEEREEEERRRQLAEQQQRQRQFQRQQQLQALEYGEDARQRQRRAPRPLIADEYPEATERQQVQQLAGAAQPRAASRQLLQQPVPVPRINLGKLDMAALKRCRTYYQLPEQGACASKDDLVSLVTRRFAEQTVDEAEVISHFLRAAKRHSGSSYRH